MPAKQNDSWTFDAAAAAYEKMRPGYDAALYRAILDYCPLDEASRVVEVGIGAGQATLPFLRTGCCLTAVEPGENLARRCCEKFAEYPAFRVVNAAFEDAALESGAFDLIYAASAFHWVPEEIGYRKAHDLLRPGGAFARFANRPYPCKDQPELMQAVQAAYARYYYPFHRKEPQTPREFGADDARRIARIAEGYGFEDVRCELFFRTRTFTAQEYVALLGTYSDHLVIEEHTRRAFFDEIGDAIERHGGELRVLDVQDLELARKGY